MTPSHAKTVNGSVMTDVIRFFLKLLVLGGVASALAFQAASPPNGTSVYKRRCMMCHGADGKGFAAIKSPDFTDPKWQASVKDKELIEVVRNGKKGTHMPGFAYKLKDDEIQAVVEHIRSFNSKKK
jgi:cytochrome c oxidase cbb3-type subunit 3